MNSGALAESAEYVQREQLQLQGIQFPATIRDEGASIELLSVVASGSGTAIEQWIVENHFSSDKQWGLISQANTKEEIILLSLSFRKVLRTRYKISTGRLTRLQEESTEPEIGELHFRPDGSLELYSVSAKQRNAILHSLEEAMGDKDAIKTLLLSKKSMISLMKNATEVSSVSLTGLGNPFFSEMTLSGADPSNSRTFKEMISGGVIKSFRAKFHMDSNVSGEERAHETHSMLVSVSSNCKVRFFSGGQNVVAQSDIEDFLSRVKKLATSEAETA